VSERSERQVDGSKPEQTKSEQTEPEQTESEQTESEQTKPQRAADPTAGDARAQTRHRRGIRVRTVVFGLVLLAISASVLVTLLSTMRVDATAVTVVALIAAGTALLAGGLAAAVREARGGPGS
jgi:hypothetical protein